MAKQEGQPAGSGGGSDIAAFFERYHVVIYNFAYGTLLDRQEAEDVLQEIFVRAIEKGCWYGSEARFRKWCYRVATNLAIDRMRKRKRRRSHSLEELDERKGEALSLRERVGSSEPSPDEVLGQIELARQLETAVGALPLKDRRVFLLRQNSNLAFREIAEVVGEPLNTVLSRMHRSLGRLREVLGHYQGMPGSD